MKSYKRLELEDGKTLIDKSLFTHIEDSLSLLHEIGKEIKGGDGVNITDINPYELHRGFISSSNVWNNVNDKYQHIVIPVDGTNSILSMTGSADYYIYYAGVRSYTQPANGSEINFSTATGWTGRKILKDTTIVDNIPNDVKYLIICVIHNTSITVPLDFNLTSEAGGGTLEILEQRINKLEKIGVNYLALGDSITEGYYSVPEDETDDTESIRAGENSYVEVLARLKGFNLTNKGVGGSGWLKRGSTQAPKLNAREQIDALNEDGTYKIDFTKYDLCTLCWGVNDWKGLENLGSFEDGLNPEVESVYSNIRYCIETILQRNPNLKLIVISPVNSRRDTSARPSSADINWGIGYEFNGKTLEDFFVAIKEVCEYYGVEFIDMLHNSVINRVNAETLLPDKVHPSLEAHILMGKELAGKIKYGC